MEFGGTKTSYLFVDMLEKGKKYRVEVCNHVIKQFKGKDVPFLVLVGNIEGEVQEYELCIWKTTSKEKFDTKVAQIYDISLKGKFVFFEKV